MISVRFDVNRQKLDKKIESIGPLTRRSLEQIGQTEVASIQNRIAVSKTAPDGTAWAPWSMSTMRARMSDGTAHLGLLYRTGDLFRSIYYKVTNLRLEVGSSSPYARFLQNGTSNIPARPFIGWTSQTINRLKMLIATEMNK